jgi:hypothetical protein
MPALLEVPPDPSQEVLRKRNLTMREDYAPPEMVEHPPLTDVTGQTTEAK